MGVLYLNDYQKLRGTEKVIASLDKGKRKENEKPEAVTPVNAPEEKGTEVVTKKLQNMKCKSDRQ